ncbi:MAG: recombinase family protein, partial [Roseococcus sp.]
MLSNRTYLGEAMPKGKSHPGEHDAIVPQAMWDAAQALLTISPRTRANRTRCQTPSLLRGLIFGSD